MPYTLIYEEPAGGVDRSLLVREHPDFGRYFKRPLYYGEAVDSSELSDEAWDLANHWAVPLREGDPMTLRQVMEYEELDTEALDRVLAGEVDEDDADVLDLVTAGGYLSLYCTGTLDAEGLDLLERAVAASAVLDPDDPGLQAAAREIRAYRETTGR